MGIMFRNSVMYSMRMQNTALNGKLVVSIGLLDEEPSVVWRYEKMDNGYAGVWNDESSKEVDIHPLLSDSATPMWFESKERILDWMKFIYALDNNLEDGVDNITIGVLEETIYETNANQDSNYGGIRR